MNDNNNTFLVFTFALAAALAAPAAASAQERGGGEVLVPVTDDCSKIRPFQRNGDIVLDIANGPQPGMAPTQAESAIYTVTSQRLLVIDTITVKATYYKGMGVKAWITTIVNGKPTTHFLVMNKQFDLPDDSETAVTSLPLRIYADPGTEVVWGFYHENYSRTSKATISLSGQLICN